MRYILERSIWAWIAVGALASLPLAALGQYYAEHALITAASNGSVAKVRQLIANNPSLVDYQHFWLWTDALWRAKDRHDELGDEVINAIVSKADLKYQTEDGFTVARLFYTSYNTLFDRSEVKRLLKLGANPNSWTKWSQFKGIESLLEHYAGIEDADMVRALLAAGADPNLQDMYGNTALHAAVHFGSSFLNGIPEGSRRGNGTAEERQRQLATVRVLLVGGADPNIRSKDRGITPFYLTFLEGTQPAVVRAFITHKADVSLTDLGEIVKNSRPERASRVPVLSLARPVAVVRELVQAGAKVNARDSFGATPLHWAVRFNLGRVNTIEWPPRSRRNV